MTARNTLFFSTVLVLLPAHGASFPAVPFSHKDWEIVCDNTRTCRAAGYWAENAERKATVLLTRRAGPSELVHVQIRLAEADEGFPSPIQMRIDGRPIGPVRLNDEGFDELSIAQSAALLGALAKDSKLSWTADGENWTVSTAGANAVLLKMDEFQGRIGTSGALVRKGTKPESSVLAALPVPELRAVRVKSADAIPNLVPAKQRSALLAELRPTIAKDEMAENSCEKFAENVRDPKGMRIYRLSDRDLLVSVGCWTAAYNTGDAYWVANAQAPYSPTLVTTNGTGYAAGQIESWQKGRGIGDCISTETWTWDGRRFAQTESVWTGMCREVALGGAWKMPIFVSKVTGPD